MTKFRFNYLENRLWKLNGDYAYEISEDQQFRSNGDNTPFGGDGFLLGDNHFITFNLYPTWMRVFYQVPHKHGELTYYRKDIALNWKLAPTLFSEQVYPEIIEFELTKAWSSRKNKRSLSKKNKLIFSIINWILVISILLIFDIVIIG